MIEQVSMSFSYLSSKNVKPLLES